MQEEEVELPMEIVTTLLQLALKTEVGVSLLAGFKLGNPKIKDLVGVPTINVVGTATLRIHPHRD